jgi:hypothetical protein
MKKRILALLALVALMMVMLAMSVAPAVAQGGCKAFGQNVVSDVQASPPAGQFIRTLAPLNDEAHSEQVAFCQ